MPLQAQTEDASPYSENFSLAKFLPNFEKIYREALTTPFQEAGKKIYDDDIAQFYHLLLGKASLDKSDEGEN